MRIDTGNSEDPIMSFFLIKPNDGVGLVKATAIRKELTWGYHYMHDYLVDAEYVENVQAIANILGIITGVNSKDDFEIYMMYLESKYPTYSYH